MNCVLRGVRKWAIRFFSLSPSEGERAGVRGPFAIFGVGGSDSWPNRLKFEPPRVDSYNGFDFSNALSGRGQRPHVSPANSRAASRRGSFWLASADDSFILSANHAWTQPTLTCLRPPRRPSPRT